MGEGSTYESVKIGKQIWMAKNLNIKIKDSFCHSNFGGNCKKYGRLYTWEAAKKACPKGWHLPSDKEWKELLRHSGGYHCLRTEERVGDSKKSYNFLTKKGEDSFGALLGGARGDSGRFYAITNYGYYWSASEHPDRHAWYYTFDRRKKRYLSKLL